MIPTNVLSIHAGFESSPFVLSRRHPSESYEAACSWRITTSRMCDSLRRCVFLFQPSYLCRCANTLQEADELRVITEQTIPNTPSSTGIDMSSKTTLTNG